MTLPAMPWVPEISIGCFRQSWGPKADFIDRNVGRARVLLSRARLKSLPTETCTHKQGEGDVQPRPHDLHDSEKSKGKLTTLGRGMWRELVDEIRSNCRRKKWRPFDSLLPRLSSPWVSVEVKKATRESSKL